MMMTPLASKAVQIARPRRPLFGPRKQYTRLVTAMCAVSERASSLPSTFPAVCVLSLHHVLDPKTSLHAFRSPMSLLTMPIAHRLLLI